jgi:hypothetical protein
MKYNGWKNWTTWNVALWIENDEGFYHMALHCADYADFVATIKDLDGGTESPASFETPDGASWTDSGLDTEALDEMIQELKS